MKTRVHIVHPSFLNPANPISVNLIGAGGTGSQMLTALAKINAALGAFGHAGLQVTVFDDDTVERPNLARQLFTEYEIGMNKAVVLINRYNCFFGTNWKAVPERFESFCSEDNNRSAKLTISCVDTLSARIAIEKTIALQAIKANHRDSCLYLMDFGNSKDSGQVVLSTIGKIKQAESKKNTTVDSLPSLTTEYAELLASSEQGDDTPSCSLAEALDKQELFINPVLANIGASLLWTMFRDGIIQYRGFFLNLGDFRTQPIVV
ncbi:PRTRC system ThiF family protein [Pedobacter miscanthi]|uniref:PRTRC system ThiF family protein n=1 Tax=Pedobacter miscanthi TaxID=2259170 RepID=UPI00293164C8|nr:PRTRC system ThiF family protein [Pedobacter miscanthi]